MKKHTLLLLVLLLQFILGASGYASAPPIRFGVYQNSPLVFTDEDGRASGIFIDVLEYIADKEGWTIEYVPGDWADLLDQLERGEIDLIGAIAYTEARSALFDFSAESVITNWGQIYTQSDAEIASILDLEGKTLAVLKADIHAEAVENLLEGFDVSAHLVEVEDYPSVFSMLQRGEADAGVVNRLVAIKYAGVYDVSETSIIFNPIENRYASTKGVHQDLLTALDANLRALKADDDSVYYQSLDRWFGGVSRWQMPKWLPWAGLIFGGLLLTFAVASFVLRSQVRAKTQELQAEVTERKQAEEELKKHREHLEELVKERTNKLEEKTADLEQANVRLQEADRLKSVFLASMSHELRTPLNSIIGFTGIILMGMVGEISEEQRKQLTLAKNSAHHLLSLINDILDISKIEAGKVKLSLEEFRLDDVTREVVETFSPAVSEKGLELLTEMPAGITLFSDRRRTKQVLMNLVSNAIKFTDQGSVKIAAGVLDETLEMRVIDTGIGIKREDRNRLFEPFQQVDMVSMTKKYEGTGLGLYLCKKLVTLLGGEISAKSEHGRGSEFAFTVPLTYEGEQRKESR